MKIEEVDRPIKEEEIKTGIADLAGGRYERNSPNLDDILDSFEDDMNDIS